MDIHESVEGEREEQAHEDAVADGQMESRKIQMKRKGSNENRVSKRRKLEILLDWE